MTGESINLQALAALQEYAATLCEKDPSRAYLWHASKDAVQQAAHRFCPDWKIVLGGSMGKGTEIDCSDMDLVVVTSTAGGQGPEVSRKVRKKFCEMVKNTLQREGIEVSEVMGERAVSFKLPHKGAILKVDVVFDQSTHTPPIDVELHCYSKSCRLAVKLFKALQVSWQNSVGISDWKGCSIEGFVRAVEQRPGRQRGTPDKGATLFVQSLQTLADAQDICSVNGPVPKAYLPPTCITFKNMGQFTAWKNLSCHLLKALRTRVITTPKDVGLLFTNQHSRLQHLSQHLAAVNASQHHPLPPSNIRQFGLSAAHFALSSPPSPVLKQQNIPGLLSSLLSFSGQGCQHSSASRPAAPVGAVRSSSGRTPMSSSAGFRGAHAPTVRSTAGCHGRDVPSSASLTCGFNSCKEQRADVEALRKHMWEQHRRHRCVQCNKHFESQEGCTAHMKAAHT